MKLFVDVPAYALGLQALAGLANVEVHTAQPPHEQRRIHDPDLLRDAEVLFCVLPPTNFEIMQALKWVQVASSGFDQLLGLNLPGRGIRATNCRGCVDVPIAEWVISMLVNLARNLPQMFRNQSVGAWDRAAEFQREVRGSTMGIWGYGGIGRETARLARQMGLKVHVMTRNGISSRENTYLVPGTGDPEGTLPDRVFKRGEEEAFLSELDFLVLALPMTGTSRGLIGERELRLLPPRSYVLNPARGPIIQEAALLRALRENWIAGAALDTHFHYPLPTDHPLWKMPNVIITPHIAGSGLSTNFDRLLWDLFVQNVARHQSHQPLLNEILPRQLSGE